MTAFADYDKLNGMENTSNRLEQAQQAADRLARLNVDSIWARRAGGLRGSLLHNITLVERGPSPRRLAHLEHLIRQACTILAQAAREIPDPEERQRLSLPVLEE
ncbi:MAG: hypothetical protein ACOYYS_23530 [Chloroflexota bacterium]